MAQPFLFSTIIIGFVAAHFVRAKPFERNWFILIVILIYLGGVIVLVSYVSCLRVVVRE